VRTLAIIALIWVLFITIWIAREDNEFCGVDAKCRVEMESPQ
jgi:ABC-type cobalt transport system substrate-binding protein